MIDDWFYAFAFSVNKFINLVCFSCYGLFFLLLQVFQLCTISMVVNISYSHGSFEVWCWTGFHMKSIFIYFSYIFYIFINFLMSPLLKKWSSTLVKFRLWILIASTLDILTERGWSLVYFSSTCKVVSVAFFWLSFIRCMGLDLSFLKFFPWAFCPTHKWVSPLALDFFKRCYCIT